MVNKKSTSYNISTQGVASGNATNIATQGFIEPILGDIILGGEATVNFIVGGYTPTGGLVTGGAANAYKALVYTPSGGIVVDGNGVITMTQNYFASGGLVIGGAADISVSVIPTVGGNVSTGGAAQVRTLWNVIPQGGLITGGDAIERLVFNFTSDGGLVIDGAGNVNVTFTTGDGTDGGLNTGGSAGVDTVGIEFGRGGARIPRRTRTPFAAPKYDPDDFFTPMDYLKRIQKVLDDAEKAKIQQFKYLSKGTLQVKGRSKLTVIHRDLANPEMLVTNNPPLTPIELELPNVFSKGATAKEIAELEDHLLLNDMLGLGNYKIKKGNKARFIHGPKQNVGGKAEVKFVSGAAKSSHLDIHNKRKRMEDDELVLELNLRSRQEREEEELRLLGILD